MGDLLSTLFIPLDSLPGLRETDYSNCTSIPPAHPHYTFGGVVQLFFLASVYGYILFHASNMIADGSELLLLIPSIAPIVGSVVLPILGAVPDGAIVLFSGLGPDAQKELEIGVGALAGSTIMLLTIPWFLSVFGGRVNIVDGHCTYKKPVGAGPGWKKLDGTKSTWTETGVEPEPSVLKAGARTMFVTCASYCIIQGAAFAYGDDAHASKHESAYALVGLILCVVFFAWYLWQQIAGAATDKVLQDVVDELRVEALKKGMLSLTGAFVDFLNTEGISTASSNLLDRDMRKERFRATVKKFFIAYDVNGDGCIDRDEFRLLLRDLHVPHDEKHVDQFIKEMDHDGSGDIQFEEFVTCMVHVVQEQSLGVGNEVHPVPSSTYGATQRTPREDTSMEVLFDQAQSGGLHQVARRATSGDEDQVNDGEESEEEEEMPEDLADLPPDQQKRWIIVRALKMMTIGTITVLLFSDPMVAVLGEIGNVMSIRPFYISFVLAPLASNASELIASYNYAVKKTTKTITISLSALEGAAIMNNTFCLGIFLALVYFRGLRWSFSAETISIIVVQLIVCAFAQRRVQTVSMGLIVGAMFPASIILVAFLESPLIGLD